jgi:chromosomal replication initiation ATPase DnaA
LSTAARSYAFADVLIQRIGADRYGKWFENRTRFTFDGETLIVGVATAMLHEWLAARYAKDLTAATVTAFGRAVPIQFRVDGPLLRELRDEQAAAKEAHEPEAVPVAEAVVPPPATPKVEHFVPGPPPTLFDAPKPAANRR